MTKSYGLSPTLDVPADLTPLADIRTSPGSARCCQFFNYSLPPAWYFFTKTIKTYTDDRLGLSVTSIGNWQSNLTRLHSTTLLEITSAPTGLELIKHTVSQPSILYEFYGNLEMVGGSQMTVAEDPTGVITPTFIGQNHLEETLQVVWLAVGPTSADWIQIGAGGGS